MRKGQRGDTLIEVMLAFVVFSLAVVGSIMIMNKGLATAQRSLEITLVRQQIDAQLTMLDNFKQNDKAGWKALIATAGAGAALPPALSTITTCPGATDLTAPNIFFMAGNNAVPVTKVQPYAILPTNYKPAQTFASVDAFATKVPASTQPVSYGIWATIVKSEGFIDVNSYTHAYDIDIRACWYGVGDSANRPTIIATVVRVYDEN